MISTNSPTMEFAKFATILFTTLVIVVTHPNWAWAVEAQQWAKTIKTGPNEKTTTLQFYFHDTPSGKSPSAVLVAQPINKDPPQNGFGNLLMADDPLTVGPDPDSKLVGRAQGLYGAACKGEIGLVMVLSYNFMDGDYNGSSISIMGRNAIMNPVRELPVVGGTGVFRMARGYALAHTYWFNLQQGDAIVGYNVTIVHY